LTYTAEDVREMDINEITRLIEKKTGRPVSVSMSMWLALAHGASRAGGNVMSIDLSTGETRKEGLDYEKLAELFNKPDVPKEPRPAFTLRIPNPDHFLETLGEAEKAGDEAYERLKNDIFFLIVWAMREYRDGLTIQPDLCEHSFYWYMTEKGHLVFNGGLIRHGDRWSIHT